MPLPVPERCQATSSPQVFALLPFCLECSSAGCLRGYHVPLVYLSTRVLPPESKLPQPPPYNAQSYYPLFVGFILTWEHFFSLLIEREERREKERETSMRETSIGCLLVWAWTRDWTYNLGMCPDQESNLRPFGLWDDTPTNWATQARAHYPIFNCS